TGDSLYCLHCGALQKGLNCKHIFERDSKVCGECGTEKGKKAQQQEHSLNEQQAIHNEKQSVAHASSGTAGKQSSNGAAPVNQANAQQPAKKSLNVKWVIGIIAVIAIAAALYFFIFNNAQGTPEETVENFISAMDAHKNEKMEALIRPSNRKELIEYFYFTIYLFMIFFVFLGVVEFNLKSKSIEYVE